jgi:tetratricopeptide (TPR) repeat protein
LTKALFHAQEAVNLARQHNEEGAADALALGILGVVGWKARKLSQNDAEVQIRHGIKIAESLEMRPAEAFGYEHLGTLFSEGGQWEKARENFKKAEEIYLQIGLDFRSYWLRRNRDLLAQTDA